MKTASEVTYTVSCGALNSTHSLTQRLLRSSEPQHRQSSPVYKAPQNSGLIGVSRCSQQKTCKITILHTSCVFWSLQGQENQGNRAMPQLLFFCLKFVDNIHYKFKSSQALKARLQSFKYTGVKQNLTQKWPF